LRALITADHDLVPSDPWGYRIAIAESFRKRAIFPHNMPTFGEETLRWLRPENILADELFQKAGKQLDRLVGFIHIDPGPGQRAIPRPSDGARKGAREELFELTRDVRRKLHDDMRDYILKLSPQDRNSLGKTIGLDLSGDKPRFEVHTVGAAER